jgi:CubicO group peptidase (beta-lactamase class C family)
MRSIAILVALAMPALAHAAPLDPATAARIDAAVERILKQSDTPSASIAVVKDGQIAYLKAYGHAVLAPPVKATTKTRYKIGSVSKELVAAAALKLQEEGKLSLDDKVSKWIPDLTDADKITVRQLLTHTSGYSDYWPQDYLMAPMQKPITADAIMAHWAKQKLDFQPGEDWQYSNTGYVVAGRIIEKAAGAPLGEVVKSRVFTPLHMDDAGEADDATPETGAAVGYEHKALGPLRRTAVEGRGWLFSAGEFAMSPESLAKWDLSLIARSLLKPESYAQEFIPAKLKGGRDTGYALGLDVAHSNGRTLLSHGGEVTGFLSANAIYPDDKAAIVILTNTMSGRACGDIGAAIAYLILPPKGVDPLMRKVFADLQAGRPDRSQFTDNLNAYFDAATLADYATSLGPLGEPTSFRQTRTNDRGGMKFYAYAINAGGKRLNLSVYVTPDGKIEQFLIAPDAS